MIRLVYFSFLLAVFILTTSATCQEARLEPAPNTAPNTTPTTQAFSKPIMSFDKDHITLGTVKRGEKRSFSYAFTNTGNTALEIDIITSCNCTTLDYSTTPVPPKGAGKIEVVFDSTEKEASETVDITIVLKNLDENKYPMIYELTYDFELEE